MQADSASVREVLERRHQMEDLYEARRQFLRNGSVSEAVRPIVHGAWKRAQALGMDPCEAPRQEPDPNRVYDLLEEHRGLVESADPFLNFIHETLETLPHILFITDANGIVLKLLADSDHDPNQRKRCSIYPGASRREEDAGCTATGIALREKKPVLLLGPEHFAEDHTDWTCIGIPLRDVSGEVAGTLNLSVPNEHIHVHTWGWMLSVSREIESSLCEADVIGEVDRSLADFQNPLHAVRGVLELLASELQLSPTHAAFLYRAQRATVRLGRRLRSLVAKLHASQSRLVEANRNQETFLATLAHEMAGPLSALKMSTGLLEKKYTDPAAVTRLQHRMTRLVGRLLRLLDDLRDVSSIRQGKLRLQKEPLRLSKVITQAVETVEPLIEERSHKLSVEIKHAPLVVEADPDRLVQVMANLLTNAAKYTEPEGRIWLTAQRSGEDIQIAVRDSGVGISPDLAPHIFDLFAQDADNRHGGLGIGLHLVQNLVELHGGRIEAHSDGPGMGSEFVIALPAAPQETHHAENAP